MNRRVYIETTIPSFYYEARSEPEMAARRAWTREWWDDHRWSFDVVTSVAVFHELENGEFPHRDDALALIEPVTLIEIDEAIADIVDVYTTHHLMPADPAGDALHLALASYHRCDFLLTWNCRHLANANKFAHIRRINGLLGLLCLRLLLRCNYLGMNRIHEGRSSPPGGARRTPANFRGCRP